LKHGEHGAARPTNAPPEQLLGGRPAEEKPAGSPVRMLRGGRVANVHPDEVARYADHGYVRDAPSAADAAGRPESDPAPEAPPAPPPPVAEMAGGADETEETDETPESVSVFRLVDGEQNARASRANLTRSEAEAYVAERPDAVYAIVVDED